MPHDTKRDTQGRVGNTRQDYEDAAEECGSITEAAEHLGVTWQTVQEQWKRYEIVNPRTGKVPGE